MRAYKEMYLSVAMKNFADMLEYASLDLKLDPDLFFKLFIDSHFSKSFEIGNPSIVAGHSGIELAKMVLEENDYHIDYVESIYREERSDIYWAGWILAYFQWYTNLSFSEIWKHITIRKLQKMYPTLHEADISKSVETMQRTINTSKTDNIATLRIIRGLTQKELAQESSISISCLRNLEHGKTKFENLSLKKALALAKALNVDVRELS